MLEIGQKVRVKKNLIVDNFYGGGRFHNGMSKYKGKIGKVGEARHYDNSKYGVSVECEGYDWTEEMLEIIK